MRRPRYWCRLAGRFLQCQKPFGQPIEFGTGLLNHFPLLGKLVGQFIDHLGLMGSEFFQLHQSRLVAHGGNPLIFQTV